MVSCKYHKIRDIKKAVNKKSMIRDDFIIHHESLTSLRNQFQLFGDNYFKFLIDLIIF